VRRFEGKHVLVTGASRGIGRAIVLRLAAEGARLTLVARSREGLEETAAAAGGARVEPCDIRVREHVDRAFEAAAAAEGPFFALAAVSGIGGPNEPGPDDRFADLVATNLSGTYWCVRAAERSLEPGPEPRHIVVISSILARIAVPGHTGYSASKAGLLGLVRSLAAELAPGNVQVNAICPGWVRSDMAWKGIDLMAATTGGTRASALDEAMREVPLGRMVEPDEIAGTVAWLLSADARGMTGQAVDHNGGAWMG
jgi:NAD(P)-dependent dehydrogenase (short-subunit alcohol dehydrogenase family)